jgi:anti-anti-sigma factor
VKDHRITTSVEHRDGVTVLAVGGEIDMASAPTLKEMIADVLAEHPPALILDLSAVRFLASAGLRILAETREKTDGSARFSVVAKGPVTARIIRLVKLDEVLSVHATLADALTAVKEPEPF